MQRKLLAMLLSFVLCVQVLVPSMKAEAAQTIYDNKVGTQDGYNYELWKDYGTTSMTLDGWGNFSCQWSNIGNALFRKGVKFDSTKTYQQIGNISCNYGCDFRPNGNSYLCVYGWMTDPLVEYYIVESWGDWRPPGASSSKGTITVDGGTYEVYETTRVNQPSIQGDTTFQQYWSVRTSKKTSGTISVSEHFKAWERMGMKCGKLYEAALNVEGYKSSGSANVYKNEFTVGGSSSSGNSGSTGNTGNSSGSVVDSGKGLKVECEKMTVSGQYAGTIDSPFDGVALYANDESCSFTQNFDSDTHSFTLKGCSNNSNMAKVDLIIGGENKGTFYYGDEYPAEYTIENVKHKTGKQKVELVVNSDDGTWDAYTDFLFISGISDGTTGEGNNGGNSNNGNTGNTGNTGNAGNTTQDSNVTKTECEKMTIGGKYAGSINSPFDGVALYANDDVCSYNQYFAYDTHDFTLRGCSNNSNMARVDLIIGGENKGTFYFGDEYPAEYTIENVKHKTGDQKVQLIVNSDDGNWDAYVDYLLIGSGLAAGTGTSNGNASSGNKPSANTKLVALTFDDGPSPTTTNQVLDILEKYNVPGTFFLIGKQVTPDTREIMERQLSLGCELGSHSYTHEDMSMMSANDVRNQMTWTSSAIKNTVNYDVKFFRPPYLAVSNTMYQNIDLDFIQGIDSGDWQSNVSANERANNVLKNVKDGSIILMHDFEGNNNTVQALPTIIEGLQKQGYTLVTVSELFKQKGVNPGVEYKIWSNVLE